MSRFAVRVERIKDYWGAIFDPRTPTFHSCVTLSVMLLGALYLLGLAYMIPASIVRAFRK